MRRTLIRRGLAVVSTGCLLAVGLSTGPASALHRDHSRGHLVLAHGTWVDPGAITDSITPNAAGTAAQVAMHGGTIAKGDFAGTSTYTLNVNFDVATNVVDGNATETYRATLGKWGHGHVTFAEHVNVAANGDTLVSAVIVGGDGVFRGAKGFGLFQGTSTPVVADPNLPQGPPSSGPYVMSITLAR